jgi:regulator of cell morphogenesis and NO signaling
MGAARPLVSALEERPMPKDENTAAATPAAARRDTPALIELIVSRYHRVHLEDLAEAVIMAEAVEAVHTTNPACPRGLASLLTRWAAGLEPHHRLLVGVLFRLLRRAAADGAPLPMARADHDHNLLEGQLEELVRLTGYFCAPADACVTWRELCQLTAKLYADLREHIRLETEELFPRFEPQIAPAQRRFD